MFARGTVKKAVAAKASPGDPFLDQYAVLITVCNLVDDDMAMEINLRIRQSFLLQRSEEPCRTIHRR